MKNDVNVKKYINATKNESGKSDKCIDIVRTADDNAMQMKAHKERGFVCANKLPKREAKVHRETSTFE